jgi:hypothetical protein
MARIFFIILLVLQFFPWVSVHYLESYGVGSTLELTDAFSCFQLAFGIANENETTPKFHFFYAFAVLIVLINIVIPTEFLRKRIRKVHWAFGYSGFLYLLSISFMIWTARVELTDGTQFGINKDFTTFFFVSWIMALLALVASFSQELPSGWGIRQEWADSLYDNPIKTAIKVFSGKGVPKKRVILFLAAHTKDLNLDVEIREVTSALKQLQHKSRFEYELVCCHAVRVKDMQLAMHVHDPYIVHFSGHGIAGAGPTVPGSRDLDIIPAEFREGGGIIITDDETGKTNILTGPKLREFFASFRHKVHCVVLNACYSGTKGLEISKVVPFVVGMDTAIDDKVAIVFARGFYTSIGAGEPIEIAFQQSAAVLMMESAEEVRLPILHKQRSTE